MDVLLRRNPRARRLILRIGRDGPVLTVPARLREREAQAFLEKNEAWLRERMSAAPASTLVAHGSTVMVAGQVLNVRPGKGRVEVSGDDLLVPGASERAGAHVAAFLKADARLRLTRASETHARTLGRSFAKITLRDTKSRWGSCSTTGNLMYSWRLAMAPPEVLDYVAAHEVAHLVEFNHSRFFWRLVDDLCPDYPYHRAWLKESGPELHGYRFNA